MLLKKIFLFICFISIAATGWGAPSFLPGTEDIPLMQGLTIDKSDHLNFDTPGGQILILEGRSMKLKAPAVFSFYQNVLPGLGWTEKKKGVFIRDKDTLNLNVIQPHTPLIIRFEISFPGK